MIVVANTTPIISLAAIGRLDLFERLFGKIVLADAVFKGEPRSPDGAAAKSEDGHADRLQISGSQCGPGFRFSPSRLQP